MSGSSGAWWLTRALAWARGRDAIERDPAEKLYGADAFLAGQADQGGEFLTLEAHLENRAGVRAGSPCSALAQSQDSGSISSRSSSFRGGTSDS